MDPAPRTLLTSHGVEVRDPMAGGHQSTVHRGLLGGVDVVVKVVDARSSDADLLHRRADLATALATVDPRVVAPIAFDGATVMVTGHHLVTVLPFAVGRTPDLDLPDDARWLGRHLARLHSSMRQVTADLPMVASLRAGGGSLDTADVQLIHGDPGAANVLRRGDDAHVLDLGEAGLGTPAYDVSLALFSRRFEVWSRDAGRGPIVGDDAATAALLDGYADEAGHRPEPEAITAGLTVRLDALDRWLDHPHEAPVGIQRASPRWRQLLARFVEDERRSRPGN